MDMLIALAGFVLLFWLAFGPLILIDIGKSKGHAEAADEAIRVEPLPWWRRELIDAEARKQKSDVK